jgi:hypothetical protein
MAPGGDGALPTRSRFSMTIPEWSWDLSISDIHAPKRGAQKNLEVTTPSAVSISHEEISQPSDLEVMP